MRNKPVLNSHQDEPYARVFISLLVLLAASYFLAHVDLGAFNTAVGMLIAAVKAFLVVTFFMHLRQSSRVHWVAAAAGVFWLGIMITLTLSDYLSRGWLALPGAWPP